MLPVVPVPKRVEGLRGSPCPRRRLLGCPEASGGGCVPSGSSTKANAASIGEAHPAASPTTGHAAPTVAAAGRRGRARGMDARRRPRGLAAGALQRRQGFHKVYQRAQAHVGLCLPRGPCCLVLLLWPSSIRARGQRRLPGSALVAAEEAEGRCHRGVAAAQRGGCWRSEGKAPQSLRFPALHPLLHSVLLPDKSWCLQG